MISKNGRLIVFNPKNDIMRKALNFLLKGSWVLLFAFSLCLSSIDAIFQGTTPENIYPAPLNYKPISVIIEQFTDSTYNDIAILSYNSVTNNSQVDIYFGNGSGCFNCTNTQHTSIDLGKMVATSMAISSFNATNDAYKGIVIAGSSHGVGIIQIIKNSGSRIFTLIPPITENSIEIFNGITTGPFNAPKNQYQCLAATGNDNKVYLYLGNGNNSFSFNNTLKVGQSPLDISSGIFTSSSYNDLVVANSNEETITFLPGIGNGKFGSSIIFQVSGHPVAIAIGDFNADGNLDIATVSTSMITGMSHISNTVNIFLGNGEGVFTHLPPIILNGTIPNLNPSLVVGNFTNHTNTNCVDIAVTLGESIQIISSNCKGAFKPMEKTYSISSFPNFLAAGDFNHNGLLDLVFGNQSSCSMTILLQNKLVLPPLPPPPHPLPHETPPILYGNIFINHLTSQSDYVNKLFWTQKKHKDVIGYHLYRDGKLIKTVYAGAPMEYLDHNRKPGVSYLYELRSFNESNQMSSPSSLILTPSKKQKKNNK